MQRNLSEKNMEHIHIPESHQFILAQVLVDQGFSHETSDILYYHRILLCAYGLDYLSKMQGHSYKPIKSEPDVIEEGIKQPDLATCISLCVWIKKTLESYQIVFNVNNSTARRTPIEERSRNDGHSDSAQIPHKSSLSPSPITLPSKDTALALTPTRMAFLLLLLSSFSMSEVQRLTGDDLCRLLGTCRPSDLDANDVFNSSPLSSASHHVNMSARIQNAQQHLERNRDRLRKVTLPMLQDVRQRVSTVAANADIEQAQEANVAANTTTLSTAESSEPWATAYMSKIRSVTENRLLSSYGVRAVGQEALALPADDAVVMLQALEKQQMECRRHMRGLANALLAAKDSCYDAAAHLHTVHAVSDENTFSSISFSPPNLSEVNKADNGTAARTVGEVLDAIQARKTTILQSHAQEMQRLTEQVSIYILYIISVSCKSVTQTAPLTLSHFPFPFIITIYISDNRCLRGRRASVCARPPH